MRYLLLKQIHRILFERVFFAVLPQLKERWEQRQNRSLPVAVQKAQAGFEQIWVADGSTLEKLFRKLGSLQEQENAPLAGKMLSIIDLVTRLPIQIWFCENPYRSDAKFESDLLALVPAQTLLLLDHGFYHFQFFADLIGQQVHFIPRLKAKAQIEVESLLSTSYAHKDQVIRLGTKRMNAPKSVFG